MREHDRVDVRQPSRPEVTGDDAAAGGRSRHAAGVVKDRATVGQLQHDRLAMADTEKRAAQALAIGRPPGDEDAGRRPGPQQRQPPAERRAKRRKGGKGGQPRVKADQPPLGRPRHPTMSVGHVLAEPHQPLDGGELPIAEHGKHGRQRTGKQAAQQQGQPADQRPRHRQPDSRVDEHRNRIEDVKAGRHEGDGQEPDRPAHERQSPQESPHKPEHADGPGTLLLQQLLDRGRLPLWEDPPRQPARKQPARNALLPRRTCRFLLRVVLLQARRQRHPRRGHGHQPGDAQEGKLRPHIEQIDRIEDQHHETRQGQEVEADAAAAEVSRPAGGYDQHRCPNHRRLRVHQQHVEEGEGGHGGQAPTPRQQAAEDQAGESGKDAQVQSCDHQQVHRAGELEGLDLFRDRPVRGGPAGRPPPGSPVAD